MLQARPHLLPTSQAPWAKAGVSLHHPFLQRALEPEALVSEQFITHQPVQPASITACTTWASSIFIPVSSGIQPQAPPSSPVPHTLSPSQGSTRPGGYTLAGRERGYRKIEAGQRETRVGPKLLEPAPQLRGQGGGASGVTTCGSGRRLFSRTCREATQVSANDLTHCKGGAVER